MAYSLAHPWAWSPSAATRLSTHRHLVNCYCPCHPVCFLCCLVLPHLSVGFLDSKRCRYAG